MKALLDGLRTWPWRVLDWLQQEEAKRTYQFIVPIIVTFGGCWAIFGTWEARFRWSGLVLQLLGLLLVVIGLSEARKRFGRPSLLDAARSFLRRFPTLKPRTHSMIEGSGGLTFGGAAVIGFGTVGPAAPKSLEERVALIEVELKDVRAEINKAGEQIAKESRERIQALEAERRARES